MESIDDPNQKDDKIIKFGENGRFVAGRNDVLGEGGYGKVYRAFDTQTSHVVAVKIERKKLEIPAILTEKYVYQAIGPFREYWIVDLSSVDGMSRFGFFVQVEFRKSTPAVYRLMEQHTFWPCNYSANHWQNFKSNQMVNSLRKLSTCWASNW